MSGSMDDLDRGNVGLLGRRTGSIRLERTHLGVHSFLRVGWQALAIWLSARVCFSVHWH